MLMNVNKTSENFVVTGIRKVEAGSAIDRIHFLGDTAIFVLGQGDVLLQPENGEACKIALFNGALLSSAVSDAALFVGSDSGAVVRWTPGADPEKIATDEKLRWIDHVAADDDGSVAWAAGKQVFLHKPGGETRSVDIPSTAGALAFSNSTLGIAHYNGVTLVSRDGGSPKTLAFEGMHTGISFHPDGDFFVTRMRDPVLHGWCLKEGGEHAMEGYAEAVRSISWVSGGQWLATSGARYLALWPIRQPQNPISNVPILLAGYRAVSTAVACHPHLGVVAVGYADGAVLLVRIEDEAEILIKNPSGAAVVALEWNASGSKLAIGCNDGSGRAISFA